MKLGHRQIREKFKNFWLERGHKEVPPIPLVPQNDPTTLFTGSGMQQLVPFLLGEPHPLGEKLFNIQPCLRSQDIEEVGDNRHTTSFEMMGNWSLGTYFKKEQLNWFFEFLVNELHLDPSRLYVTVFKGEGKLPEDSDSIAIWKDIFKKQGVDGEIGKRIFPYGGSKNWWSRAGEPEKMPAGEPGGPDSEVFFDFGEKYHFHEHSQWKNEPCHVNCDCGRYMEIGNSVFMQYKKLEDGSFQELPKKNVDFGGGLERIAAAVNDDPDVFTTDLYSNIINNIEKSTNKKYEELNRISMRIIADHIKAAVFLIIDGVYPSNKEQGYVLRRLLRRAAVKLHFLKRTPSENINLDFNLIIDSVLSTYDGIQNIDQTSQVDKVKSVINEEMQRFIRSLEKGLKEILHVDRKNLNGKFLFDLYQNYGFPFEIAEELLKEEGHIVDSKQFKLEFNKHKELSRTASAGKFKGGLADHSEKVIRYHTATHLIHQALFDVLGDDVRQEGSNITGERLRFDFSSSHKPTPEEIKKVEDIANEKVKEQLPVDFKMMPKDEASKIGAKSFFREKYPDTVKIYYIGSTDPKTAYSKEFCGGPHVKNTKEIEHIEIYKTEKIGSNLYRLYAK